MSANSNQEDTIWEIGLGMMCKVDIEHFLRQHFVGKQFAHDPDAPDHYAVFTDGTAVYAINSESGENCPMNMRHPRRRRGGNDLKTSTEHHRLPAATLHSSHRTPFSLLRCLHGARSGVR